MPLQLDSPTVGEAAYRRIRHDIIFGRLAPAQRVKLDAARKLYAVSVSTLREILNRLCSEGLILAEGQRGFEVAPISAEGFREVAGLRLLLECHALAASFSAGDLEWEGRVVAAYHKLQSLETRMASGEVTIAELWKRYDREFHGALISACGSDVLLEAHVAVYDKYLRYQMVADIYRGDIAAREHKDLLESALRRDSSRGQATLVRHVKDCVETALARGDEVWLLPSKGQVAGRDSKASGVRRGLDREPRLSAASRHATRKRPGRAGRSARA